MDAYGGATRRWPSTAVESGAMRAMLLLWTITIVGGLTYFTVIGLTHH